MGKGRPSAIVFAAAYIALIVGLFLALGGAAYAQSPSSAADQYGTKVLNADTVQIDRSVLLPRVHM